MLMGAQTGMKVSFKIIMTLHAGDGGWMVRLSFSRYSRRGGAEQWKFDML